MSYRVGSIGLTYAMSNLLKVVLHQRDWSQRRIARELDC